MKEFLFIGQTRSKQAKDRGYHWEDGVSTAKFLFEALKKIGIDPKEQEFQNLWDDDGKLQGIVMTDLIIVAMGKTVQNKLTKLGIEHVDVVHPAARGKYKNREVYSSHLKKQLSK